jgi:hypothetical protein
VVFGEATKSPPPSRKSRYPIGFQGELSCWFIPSVRQFICTVSTCLRLDIQVFIYICLRTIYSVQSCPLGVILSARPVKVEDAIRTSLIRIIFEKTSRSYLVKNGVSALSDKMT